ncbi:Phosphatidylinositol-4-phosphate 5-kinase [Phlyctochytrium planicorne]|nr:Phosphatidylinositol-4-phosphate 5-kinase [Phlyctochytrium planicorne]
MANGEETPPSAGLGDLATLQPGETANEVKSEPASRSASSINLHPSPVLGITAMSLTPSGKPKVPMKWSSNGSSGSPSSNPLPLRTSVQHQQQHQQTPTTILATTPNPPSKTPSSLSIPVLSSSHPQQLAPISTSPSVPSGPLGPVDEDAVVSSPLPPVSPMSAAPTSSRHRSSSILATPVSASAPEPGKLTKKISVRSRSEGSNGVDSFTGSISGRKGLSRQKSDKEVLVGTPVKEGHVNYMLMYDMLTGIRVSVSRCNAKPLRPLEDADLEAAHKLAFDVTGNELTPSSRYDFKFKDYAPWAFRLIREIFQVDAAEYLLSLTGKYVLSELGSPGKSGSFFYFSQDYRFIIKTIHHSEHKFIRKVLKNYYEHVRANPQTLLSRIFGLHRVKLPGNRKIHFVVMGNVFPPNKDIHETYDLKGSTVGRIITEEEARRNPRAVLKDLNWIQKGRKLKLGPEKEQQFTEQMERDVEFLASMKIMDYSLLVGYHDLVKGNADNIRDTTLAVFEPNAETLSRFQSGVPASSPMSGHPNTQTSDRDRTIGGILSTIRRGSKASAMRRTLVESDPVRLGPSTSRLPDDSPPERTNFLFYRDMGGFRATDENNNPLAEVYYIGIIDIFTQYSATKKLEHFFKSIAADSKKISAVNPMLYGRRFVNFMKNAISRPGDPPSSPLASAVTSPAQSFTGTDV